MNTDLLMKKLDDLFKLPNWEHRGDQADVQEALKKVFKVWLKTSSLVEAAGSDLRQRLITIKDQAEEIRLKYMPKEVGGGISTPVDSHSLDIKELAYLVFYLTNILYIHLQTGET